MTIKRFILALIFGAFIGTMIGKLEPDSGYIVTVVLALLITAIVFGFGFGGNDGEL